MQAQYQALAVLSTGIYFTGLTFLKIAASGMPPLAGDRPVHLARTLLTDRTWLAGGTVVAVGACVQAASLTGLTLVAAQPMFLAGVGLLIVLAVPVMGERLTLREWGCVVVLAAATALFADAAAGGPRIAPPEAAGGATVLTSAAGAPGAGAGPGAGAAVPPWLLGSVAALSLLVPCAAFLAADLKRKGAHARPLTGVALAIDVGLLTGTAELMLKGAAARLGHPLTPVAYAYPALFAVTAPLALGQLQIALQRCRLVVVGLVATATAKTYLLLVGTLLFREPWPDGASTELAVALALSVLGIAAVPHHERRPSPARLHRAPTAR
ncbi:hypothetical protein J4557_16135 [Actinomadura nitritigenes]|uniref:Integral membrane protein n=1 Tax=Actinomadura nitritigenes TaxID=134602 RepID=A0ABS3QYH5_9ACTN|nr:hypothetical protein [Actinomadura nitritigenes]MBO2439049.1 hypothetical protein [Actinomadura nitritigenes]